MNKEEYQNPQAEIMALQVETVIAVSPGGGSTEGIGDGGTIPGLAPMLPDGLLF